MWQGHQVGPLARDGGLPGHPQPLTQCRELVAWAQGGPLARTGWWRRPARNFLEMASCTRVAQTAPLLRVWGAVLVLGRHAGARGANLNCGICPGVVSTPKQPCLEGPKSSKPWQSEMRVDFSVMTTWRRKEVFLCTFGLLCILKRRCGWMLVFLLYSLWTSAGGAVPGNLFLRWKLSSLPAGYEWLFLGCASSAGSSFG